MKLENAEMLKIVGGINISGTLLNSIAKLISTIFDVGRAIGSAISMSKSKRRC
ncbi:MAG: hypothetical protein PHH51_01380 [Bacilli bacterium]|nr:hypothetical protein [Bacilli bacterium]MDD3895702.1 hypothetical protein [Bacilli bacterium]MDD4407718.1 hypothetical protein [Bacilli bacterium]